MIRILKNILNGIRSRPLETVSIHGQQYKVTKDTLANDYDNAWFYELAKSSDHLMDIGSNVGTHSMLAFASNNIRHSLVVDANPDALTVAASNFFRNGLAAKVSFFVAFVSDKNDEEVTFWTVGTGAAGSVYKSHAQTAKKGNHHFKVRTITLDTLVDIFHYTPDLIKIDVEGAESKVLMGATRTAAAHKPAFFVEMHALEEISMEQNVHMVLTWCKQNTYNAFYLKEHTLLNDPSSVKSRGRCHILLLHKERTYPEELKSIRQSDIVPA